MMNGKIPTDVYSRPTLRYTRVEICTEKRRGCVLFARRLWNVSRKGDAKSPMAQSRDLYRKGGTWFQRPIYHYCLVSLMTIL